MATFALNDKNRKQIKKKKTVWFIHIFWVKVISGCHLSCHSDLSPPGFPPTRALITDTFWFFFYYLIIFFRWWKSPKGNGCCLCGVISAKWSLCGSYRQGDLIPSLTLRDQPGQFSAYGHFFHFSLRWVRPQLLTWVSQSELTAKTDRMDNKNKNKK